MLITRQELCSITELGSNLVACLLDRFAIPIVETNTSTYYYDLSWHKTQEIIAFLRVKKDKRPTDYSKAINALIKLAESL